jgi:hypothetical protein
MKGAKRKQAVLAILGATVPANVRFPSNIDPVDLYSWGESAGGRRAAHAAAHGTGTDRTQGLRRHGNPAARESETARPMQRPPHLWNDGQAASETAPAPV